MVVRVGGRGVGMMRVVLLLFERLSYLRFGDDEVGGYRGRGRSL